MLGYPDRALDRANQAVALAKHLNQPFSMCYALFHAGMLHHWMRETALVRECADAVLDIAEEHEYLVWKAVGTCLHGAALAEMEQPQHGLAQIRIGLDLYQDLKSPPVFWSLLLYLYAEVCSQAGIPEQGLSQLEKSAEIINTSSGGTLFPEFFRLTGELLLAHSPENAAAAELRFQQALGIARELQATMLELRVALSLSRLWLGQGKKEQASQVLRDVYDRFTEGYTTADLVEAKELLNKI
jgi:adenylate cyclase